MKASWVVSFIWIMSLVLWISSREWWSPYLVIITSIAFIISSLYDANIRAKEVGWKKALFGFHPEALHMWDDDYESDDEESE